MTGARILVVDDDDSVRAVAVRQLTSLGHEVIAASGGTEALAVLECTPGIDLLFVDVTMPGGPSGPEVAERAARAYGGLRVLFASGNFDTALPASAHCIIKPYRKSELAQKLAEVLGASATQSQSRSIPGKSEPP